jgi:hypothetical protein
VSAGVISILIALTGVVPHYQPAQPPAKVIPRESALPPRSTHLTGVATWYRYVPGGAAAGPQLRRWLGPTWRGQRVKVCADTQCVSVTLSDWCLCSEGNRVIDLDIRTFAKLAQPSQGVLSVTVS